MSSQELSPRTTIAYEQKMPYNCTTPQVLDLCIRRRSGSKSPKPEGARQPLKTSPDSSIILPNYLQNPLPNSINNNLEHPKSINQYQTSIDQRQSPVNQFQIDQFRSVAEQFHNNNFMEHSTSPFLTNQFANTPVFRPLPLKSDESSEEGSIKSDDFGSNFVQNAKVKPPRPFKAYPKDPFFLALGADTILGKESAEAFAEFRQKMLCQIRANNPDQGITNAKMRRSTLPSSTEDMGGKDASYWEKRKKNNEAAKRSRDARRVKEDEIAIRAAFLEQENLKLKYEIAALRNENTKFRCLLYN